jgi:tetratricopeptide (TPR) repeat protein
MTRHLHSIALGLAVLYAVPSFAQSFQGLDLSGEKKSRTTKKKKASPAEGADKSGDAASAKDAQTETDWTKTTPIGDSNPTPPPSGSGAKAGNKPAMAFDAVDVSGKSGERQKLEMVTRLFKDEQYEAATLAAYDLMQDPKYADLHLEAHYLMAKALYRMGMYHASLAEFTRILERGPQTKYFPLSLEWLFYIARKTVNEAVVLETIARYSKFDFPERFRNEFRYLLARYHFVRGRALDEVGQKDEANKSYNEVKRLALQVPDRDTFYPRAKYLEGLSYYRDNNFSAALESMKRVIRLTRVANKADEAHDVKANAALRELAFMQLARTHYEHRQNRYAIHYLNKVERGTGQWLEALFEAAWAHYRIGQYEQALGNLITLSSPFFRDEYFPEALILKAVIYYENCRYRESTMIIEDFDRIYGPVQQELERLMAKNLDASEYYTMLSEVQKKNQTDVDKSPTDLILERVLRLALTDKDLKKTNDSILELEHELDTFNSRSEAFRYSNLIKQLSEDLKKQREGLIKKAGIMAKGKLEYEVGELKRLWADGLRIKFETTDKEKQFLEAQLLAEGKKDIVRNYKYSVAVNDSELYWPFQGGEYWRDELGTYQYTLTKGCVDRVKANRTLAGSQ